MNSAFTGMMKFGGSIPPAMFGSRTTAKGKLLRNQKVQLLARSAGFDNAGGKICWHVTPEA